MKFISIISERGTETQKRMIILSCHRLIVNLFLKLSIREELQKALRAMASMASEGNLSSDEMQQTLVHYDLLLMAEEQDPPTKKRKFSTPLVNTYS